MSAEFLLLDALSRRLFLRNGSSELGYLRWRRDGWEVIPSEPGLNLKLLDRRVEFPQHIISKTIRR